MCKEVDLQLGPWESSQNFSPALSQHRIITEIFSCLLLSYCMIPTHSIYYSMYRTVTLILPLTGVSGQLPVTLAASATQFRKTVKAIHRLFAGRNYFNTSLFIYLLFFFPKRTLFSHRNFLLRVIFRAEVSSGTDPSVCKPVHSFWKRCLVKGCCVFFSELVSAWAGLWLVAASLRSWSVSRVKTILFKQTLGTCFHYVREGSRDEVNRKA